MAEPLIVCRRCGIPLTTSATIAMGICGSCLILLETRPSIVPRPKYGNTLVTDTPQVPEMP